MYLVLEKKENKCYWGYDRLLKRISWEKSMTKRLWWKLGKIVLVKNFVCQ